MKAMVSGSRVFCIQKQRTPLSSKTNSMPSLAAHLAPEHHAGRPAASGVSATSARMTCMPAVSVMVCSLRLRAVSAPRAAAAGRASEAEQAQCAIGSNAA